MSGMRIIRADCTFSEFTVSWGGVGTIATLPNSYISDIDDTDNPHGYAYFRLLPTKGLIGRGEGKGTYLIHQLNTEPIGEPEDIEAETFLGTAQADTIDEAIHTLLFRMNQMRRRERLRANISQYVEDLDKALEDYLNGLDEESGYPDLDLSWQRVVDAMVVLRWQHARYSTERPRTEEDPRIDEDGPAGD